MKLTQSIVAAVIAGMFALPALAQAPAKDAVKADREKLKAGYPPKALDAWAKRAQTWAKGSAPADLPRVDKKAAPKQPRDVFIYFIHEAKLRAPAAAMALIERL